MIDQLQETDWKLSKGFLALQNHTPKSTTTMEARSRKPVSSNEGIRIERERERDREYRRSFSSHGNGKKALRSNYFSLESMLLLVCLTASLLILPLILPPLPPPPFLLLLLPIGILALLMILAFMPCNVRDLTYTYM